MKEELLPSERISPTALPYFDELVYRYITGLRERIRSAPSRREAELMVKYASDHFSQSCTSEIITDFLTQYLDNLIHEHWDYSENGESI
jgi:signal transduction histidine kinase